MTKFTVRFSNNISHSSDVILNWESYHARTNGATYTVFQLAFILRVTHAMYFIMITHWTFLNTFIALSECFHAINFPYKNNFPVWIRNSIVFCFVLLCFVFVFFEQKQKHISGVNKKVYSLVKKKILQAFNNCWKLLITLRATVLLQ